MYDKIQSRFHDLIMRGGHLTCKKVVPVVYYMSGYVSGTVSGPHPDILKSGELRLYLVSLPYYFDINIASESSSIVSSIFYTLFVIVLLYIKRVVKYVFYYNSSK